MRKIKSYFKGVSVEARRIRWPRRKELWTAVITVIVISVVAALVIYFEDWIVANMMQGFEGLRDSVESSSSSVAA